MAGQPFHGASLREAREAREITATALSEIIGVSKAAVSQYEHDRQTPRPEVMARICTSLNLPRAFFATTRSVPDAPIFYRSMASATKRARLRAERRYGWCRTLATYLTAFVEAPEVDFPTLHEGTIASLSLDDIEGLADDLRQHWGIGIGPISNMTWLLENKGAIVSKWDLGAAQLDAFSQWPLDCDRPFVILGDGKESCARSRFNVGHELGHLVLHRHVTAKNVRTGSDHKIMESQAHRFAAAFCLPAAAFAADFAAPTLGSFLALKRKWRLSIGMMIKRAEDLGYITPRKSRRLWMSYAKRGWKKREPLDDEQPVERPQFLARSLLLLLDNGVQTASQVSAALPFSASDLGALAGVDPKLLRETTARIDPITPLLKAPASPRRAIEGGGSVIPFPGV